LLTSAGFDPKVGAWAVAAGAAAAPPNWNREGAVAAAWVEVVGGAPKAKVELVVVVGAPKAGTAVLVAPKAAVVAEAAPNAGAAALTAPKVGAAADRAVLCSVVLAPKLKTADGAVTAVLDFPKLKVGAAAAVVAVVAPKDGAAWLANGVAEVVGAAVEAGAVAPNEKSPVPATRVGPAVLEAGGV